MNVTQNQELFLNCLSIGVPQPSVYWYKTNETDLNEGNETQLTQPAGTII